MQSTTNMEQVIPDQRLSHESAPQIPVIQSSKNAPDNATRSEQSNRDAFRVFTYAVLAKHRPIETAYCGAQMCVCGSPLVLCDYTRLAKEILRAGPEEIRVASE